VERNNYYIRKYFFSIWSYGYENESLKGRKHSWTFQTELSKTAENIVETCLTASKTGGTAIRVQMSEA